MKFNAIQSIIKKITAEVSSINISLIFKSLINLFIFFLFQFLSSSTDNSFSLSLKSKYHCLSKYPDLMLSCIILLIFAIIQVALHFTAFSSIIIIHILLHYIITQNTYLSKNSLLSSIILFILSLYFCSLLLLTLLYSLLISFSCCNIDSHLSFLLLISLSASIFSL